MSGLASYLPSFFGGVVIGLAAGSFHLLSGEIAGISGILRKAIAGPDRGWQIAFVAGLLAAGLAGGRIIGTDATFGIANLSTPVLVAGGLLVGLGTGIGNGCTSGHGVCGLARLSRRSLAAVATFMATAAITVFLVRHGGLS